MNNRLALLIFSLVLIVVLLGCGGGAATTPVTTASQPPIVTTTAPATTTQALTTPPVTATKAPPTTTLVVTTTPAITTTPPATTTTPATTPAPAAKTTLKWLGQSAFILTSRQGTKILIDPTIASMAFEAGPFDGIDAVLVSHEHGDHNAVSMASGSPLVIRGLSVNGWNAIDQKVKDVRILSISPACPVYHDNQQGALRGNNTIFILEVDGLRLAHAGDLGHTLTPEIIRAMGAIDILLLPVSGGYTIDAAAATEVVNQLKPRMVIPMHYRTATSITSFLEGKKIERVTGRLLSLSVSDLPAPATVYVLSSE